MVIRANPSQLDRICDFASSRETATTQKREAATQGPRSALGSSPGKPFTLSLVHTSEAFVNPPLKRGFVERPQFSIKEHTTGDDRQHNVCTRRAEDDCSDRVVDRCVVSVRKIDRDDVGLFAGLERTDVPIQTQCSRASKSRESQQIFGGRFLEIKSDSALDEAAEASLFDHIAAVI